jgi:hypothetical protein
MASGLHFSKLCKDCLISKEMAKKREILSQKEELKIKPKTGKKSRADNLMGKPLPVLLDMARTEFNLFIRNRDRLPNDRFYCPTCKKTKQITGDNYQACHLFPAGHYPELKFNENNVFGGCKACNYWKHGVGYEYGDWVRKKIGEVEYQKLKDLTANRERNGWKWDRFQVMFIITKYKKLNQEYKLKHQTND